MPLPSSTCPSRLRPASRLASARLHLSCAQDAPPAEGRTHQTRELWAAWRAVALKGGLERALGREAALRARDGVKAIERDALAETATAAGGEGGAGANKGGGGEGAPGGSAVLEAAVARELGLLRAA